MQGDTAISILSRIVSPTEGILSLDAAKAILEMHFSQQDNARIEELAGCSTAGTLTEDEGREYDGYIAAADWLAIMQSKARLTLKQQSSAA
jgi:hypothetical protein